MSVISKIKETLTSIVKRDKSPKPGSFPIGGQQSPGQASDYEGWAPNADRDPDANIPAHRDKPAG